MDRLCAFLIRERIDGHKIRHHEGAVKAESEMADDLVVVGLVLVFLNKSFRAGKGDVVDVLPDFIRRHADAVVRDLDRALVGADHDVNTCLIVGGQFKITDHIQLPKLCDRITAV